ncbi:MAG TPA: hypothetical protein VM099_05925, partial [Gemmatimonadaceae bacterium]|nr:hypothetical protein [Gemmatimonadaceae bacterium]
EAPKPPKRSVTGGNSLRRDTLVFLFGGFAMRQVSDSYQRNTVVVISAALITVLSACSDSADKMMAPAASVRASTGYVSSSGHGTGYAGKVKLCVDASSPAGTYKFRNSSWNVNKAIAAGSWDGVSWNAGGYDPGDGGEGWGAAGGSTSWQPAEGDNSEYTVAVGSCVTVINRTQPSDHYWNDMVDDFQSVNMTATAWPLSATFDHVDCVGDQGVVAPQPTPCGSTSNPTRAFANYDHGTQVTFVFAAAAHSTGIIAPTATTCEDYAQGTSPTLAELLVGFKGTTLNNIAPGVFFYYAQVTKGAGQNVGFTQTVNPNAASFPKYGVMQTQAYLYTYNSSTKRCTTVSTLPLSSDGTASLGGGAGLPAGNYILGVKFTTDAAKGTTVASSALRVSGALLATHNYWATVNGVSDPMTAASVNTKTK